MFVTVEIRTLSIVSVVLPTIMIVSISVVRIVWGGSTGSALGSPKSKLPTLMHIFVQNVKRRLERRLLISMRSTSNEC